MALTLTIAGSLNTDLTVRSIKASYISPWEAELFYPGRHDDALAVQLWDTVVVAEGATVRFSGRVTGIRPGGVGAEGITFTCQDARFRLENEPVRINGRGSFVWNQRGSTCNDGKGGYDPPNADGEKWTCGQIVVDILEHVLGVPGGGSGIPGHHASGCCVPDAFLTSADVAGWTVADILALDSICGEFSVDNTPVAQAISLLLALNGGFYGWYIDPATGYFVVVDLDALATTDLQAGELGEWQDKAGTQYRLLRNQLQWSLDGVCSTMTIQGADATAEEQPANIEGSSNAGKGDLGELELVSAPWLSWAAAYRPVCQPKRLATGKLIDMGDTFTPPAGWFGFSHEPRVYRGTAAGSKTVYEPSPSYRFPIFNAVSGIIVFDEEPSLSAGEKLWAWYYASVPFTVTAGPDGDAYNCFGYECTRTIFDPSMRDVSSYPYPAFSDADKTAMGILATRLLRQYCDVRRQGTLVLDSVDFTTSLDARYNVVNLTAPAGGLPCGAGPMDWANLEINTVEVTWDLAGETTEIRVANTFFMMAEYSALKDRLERNLFVKREINLSQQIYDCQVLAPTSGNDGTSVKTEGDNTIGTWAETDAAQTDSWAAGAGNVQVAMLTRMAYNDAGDQKLYGYYRTLTFDAGGHLNSVTAETRIEIDAPEENCT